MLKGKTIIELTDVNTGEVEVHEDNNMVTNALNHIFSPFGHYKNSATMFSSSDWLPYYQKLLGGILLFDNTIEEDRETLFAPASAGLVACAVYGTQNDTTNTCRGNFNTTESEVNLTEKYVKYVYDFSTSQGNGNIASVCLTSKNGGYCSYGTDKNPSRYNSSVMCFGASNTPFSFTGFPNCAGRNGGITVGVTQFLFALDPENDRGYYFRVNSTKSISIIKRQCLFKSISVFDTPSNGGRIIETIDIPEFTNGMKSTNYFSYNFNLEENALYISSSTDYRVTAGQSFSVIKISMPSWSVDEYTVSNQSNTDLDIGYGYSHLSSFCYKGYIYAAPQSGYTAIYKIKISNGTDVKKIAIPAAGQSSYNRPQYANAGRIYYCTYSHSYMDAKERDLVLNTEREEVLLTENIYTFGFSSMAAPVPVIGDAMALCCGSNFFYPGNYLATINNLDSPVTKTADKTMKVTYIIQEHES